MTTVAPSSWPLLKSERAWSEATAPQLLRTLVNSVVVEPTTQFWRSVETTNWCCEHLAFSSHYSIFQPQFTYSSIKIICVPYSHLHISSKGRSQGSGKIVKKISLAKFNSFLQLWAKSSWTLPSQHLRYVTIKDNLLLVLWSCISNV